ncbi:uncharacterized protein LOC112571112 [Pomacea canaliculata]|uniref:uncharacterized protein LOC112571112 n=1 Tax=Pomacea canaliculata TaxID=400727 RepID=UPI000D72FD02|nr:uncharacterized protein LOC112571112 [Pomacea canaliculata]
MMSVNETNQTSYAVTGLTVSRYPQCFEDPGNIMSYEARKLNTKILQCGLMPSLFFVGAPTNILSMIVFYRQGLRDRMNLCLFCLAFVDLMYVTAVLGTVSYCFIAVFLPEEEHFWKQTLMKNFLNFVYGFGYSSGWLTMIIATDRCVCILFPMKSATVISTKTMTILLASSILLINILCGVYIIKETVVSTKDDVTGRRVVMLSTTALFLSTDMFSIIENIVLSLISIFCFSVVVLTTSLTIMGLRSAMAWRQSTSSLSPLCSGSSYLKGQTVLMRMLVVVSFIYILCTAPNVALSLARFSDPAFRSDGPNCNVFTATHLFGFLTVMINSSINFFVYLTMSSRFRQELKTFLLGGNISMRSTAVSASKPIR